MPPNTRVAVIMAGGAGERFWPVSRKAHPKQLLKLTGSGSTMLEEAVDRIGPIVGIENTFIATATHLKDPILGASAGVPAENVFAEPAKRNTAGALAWATACLIARYGETPLTIAIVTADHRISPDHGFQATVRAAMETAEQVGGLGTIGISASRPETGYGYIQLGDPLGVREAPVFRVKAFKEKPSVEIAEQYLASGTYLWNSGMFFWTLSSFMDALDAASPEHSRFIRSAAEMIGANRFDEATAAFELLPNISIDYALMEKAPEVFVTKALFEWDDLGSWDALHRVRQKDASENVFDGAAEMLESTRMIVMNQSSRQKVFGLGLEDLVIVVTDDTIMICPQSRAQEVRKLSSLAEN